MTRNLKLSLGAAWIVVVLIATSIRGAEEVADAFPPKVAPPAQDRAESRPQSDEAEIARWIVELDDKRYVVRERATRRLLNAGETALDALLAAANSEPLEPADRAVWILQQHGEARDGNLRRQALGRLTRLRDRPQVSAAARDALARIEHAEAVAAIQELGGRFRSAPYVEMVGPFTSATVIVDPKWRGGDEGLRHLRHVIGLRHVIVIGTNITAKGLAELRHVKLLEELWLYGTKIGPHQVREVQDSLPPNVAVDYRRGGLLGVGTNMAAPDGTGPAVVGTVQEGSAAALAGIRVGDVIHKFEGEPVSSFKALTLRIGEHTPGDEVTLEVLRNGQPIEFKVKLGQWTTI